MSYSIKHQVHFCSRTRCEVLIISDAHLRFFVLEAPRLLSRW